MKVLVLHGPNLNLLGQREPEVYGFMTLDQINEEIAALASQLELEIDFFQSNEEGALIDRIHRAKGTYQWIIFNPRGPVDLQLRPAGCHIFSGDPHH